MNRLVSVIKRFLTVCLAGILVFIGTACTSGGLQAKTLDNNPRPEVPGEAVTNTPQGGMNQFSDVDPRRDTSRAEAKAKAVVDKAERNLSKSTSNPIEAIGRAINDAPDTPQDANRNVRRGAEDIADKAKNTAEDFAQGTQRGIENIKANTRNATQDASKAAQRAAENVGQNTSYAARDAANKVQQAAENTSDFIQDKANTSY